MDDRNYASSVWEIVSVENKDILRQLKGSVEMFGALAEIMKPEIDEAYDNGMMYASLTGGECLIRKDFKDLYLHLLDVYNEPLVLEYLQKGYICHRFGNRNYNQDEGLLPI